MDISKGVGWPDVDAAAPNNGKGDGYQVRYVFTFGAPRVGNTEFVRELHSHAGTETGFSEGWRLIQDDDPVPYTVPYFLGFVHSYVEVHLLGSGVRFKVCEPPDLSAYFLKEDPTCSVIMTPGLPDFLGDKGLYSHGNYFGANFMNKITSCGAANQENAYYNNTGLTVVMESAKRSVTSWLPF